jgi:hypothetical protein
LLPSGGKIGWSDTRRDGRNVHQITLLGAKLIEEHLSHGHGAEKVRFDHLPMLRSFVLCKGCRQHDSGVVDEDVGASKFPLDTLSRGLPEIDYPFHDKAVTVTTCGRICYNRKKSTSAGSSPARPSASNRSTTESGWPASWTMIWAISTMRHAGSNHSKTPSGRKCYPSLRYKM